MASDVDNLRSIRSNYIATLAAESAAQVTNGPKPSYSLDGESVNWDTWRDSMMARIDSISKVIQNLQSPFVIRSRGRA